MTDLLPSGRARVVGAGERHGAAIVARLRADGFTVSDASDDPSGEALDVLVVNLSCAADDVAFRSVTDARFRALLDTQFYAFVAAVHAAVPRMTGGGAIVQVASTAHLGAWGGVHRAATTAACVAIARSMALEFAPLGIRVNTVAAGEAMASDALAATIAWLAGPDSAATTGDMIVCDGGTSLQMAQALRRSDPGDRRAR